MPHTPSPKTYRVKSFGCQMNVYDGERMAESLAARGIAPASGWIQFAIGSSIRTLVVWPTGGQGVSHAKPDPGQ